MIVIDSTSLMVIVAVLGTVLWVYADATLHKIGRIQGRRSLFNMPAGLWAFGTLVLWVLFFPVYLFKRSSLISLAKENPVEIKKRNVKLLILAIVFVLTCIYIVLSFGLKNTGQIKTVKESSLEICPEFKVEQMVNGFIESPSWESGRAGVDIYFVNIKGNIPFEDKKAELLLQFKIDQKAETYSYQTLEIDGVTQNIAVANELLQKMCDSAK